MLRSIGSKDIAKVGAAVGSFNSKTRQKMDKYRRVAEEMIQKDMKMAYWEKEI